MVYNCSGFTLVKLFGFSHILTMKNPRLISKQPNCWTLFKSFDFGYFFNKKDLANPIIIHAQLLFPVFHFLFFLSSFFFFGMQLSLRLVCDTLFCCEDHLYMKINFASKLKLYEIHIAFLGCQ